MMLRLFGFGIFREKPGVISKDAVWVCFYSHYIHTGDTLASLLWDVVTEYKNDRHLVG